MAEADFPSRFGRFRIHGFEGSFGDHVEEAAVLVMGDVTQGGRLWCGFTRSV